MAISKSSYIITFMFLFTQYSPRCFAYHSTDSSAPGNKYIYLTFDDGPLNGSENIDSIIKAEKLNISVFLVGNQVKKSNLMKSYLSLYKTNQYIASGNHSFSHANGKYKHFYKNPTKVLGDILKNEEFLQLKNKIVRLPGRNIWRVGKRKRVDGNSGSEASDTLFTNGFRVYGWDLEWEHNNNGTPIQSVSEMKILVDKMLNGGNTFTDNHLVILMHDEMFQKTWEVSELKILIDLLKQEKNYTFQSILNYPIPE